MANSKDNGSVSMATSLAEKIRKSIIKKDLRVGDFFMTEAQLAQEYRVSRNIAREAVSRLRALGLLESRQKKGLIIGRANPIRAFADSLPSISQSDLGIKELSMLRYALEVGSIDLVINNATDEQTEKLEELARQFENAVRSEATDKEENEIELAFHGLILEMTGCELLSQMQFVLARFFQLYSEHFAKANNQEETIWEHYRLVDAIKDRDLDRARTMMRLQYEHLIS